jgi:glycosyltransferase involved in cell wall biosynthesis
MDDFRRINFKHTMRKGFVSVIVPVYNDPDGLVDTLNSLKIQSLPKSEYEIIVANDGSLEDITRICDTYQIKEIKIKPNSGSYFARNRALEESSGEFIAFVDADIIVPPTWLEAGVATLTIADYVGGPVHIDREKIYEPVHYYEAITAFRDKNKSNKDDHFYVTANLFLRRLIIEEIGGFDERLRSGGDNEFGKRVNETKKYVQYYNQELTVLHPPRGFHALVSKRLRITQGKKLLNNLYPDKYSFNLPSVFSLLSQILLPPRIIYVRRMYNSEQPFSFLRFYIFMWKFKCTVGWRLLKFFEFTNNR